MPYLEPSKFWLFLLFLSFMHVFLFIPVSIIGEGSPLISFSRQILFLNEIPHSCRQEKYSDEYLFLFPHENLYCWYSSEVPPFMCNHSMCFYGEVKNISPFG